MRLVLLLYIWIQSRQTPSCRFGTLFSTRRVYSLRVLPFGISPLKKESSMQLNLRTLAPALVVVTLALAGCKTAPTKTSDATATPPAGQQSTTPAAAARVDFYLAKREPGAGLREVNLPDGKLYLQ